MYWLDINRTLYKSERAPLFLPEAVNQNVDGAYSLHWLCIALAYCWTISPVVLLCSHVIKVVDRMAQVPYLLFLESEVTYTIKFHIFYNIHILIKSVLYRTIQMQCCMVTHAHISKLRNLCSWWSVCSGISCDVWF